MTHKVEITSGARRELEKLPADLQKSLLEMIVSLSDAPVPPGAMKVADTKHGYRIRVGDYRIAYLLMEDVVLVTRVAHRSEVYKDMVAALNKAARKKKMR